jgi:hypothetical protein
MQAAAAVAVVKLVDLQVLVVVVLVNNLEAEQVLLEVQILAVAVVALM